MLLTKNLKSNIPKLFGTENIKDKLCIVKLFNPNAVGTWYIVEYDEVTKDAFGYADLGYYPELGYFNLAELENYRGKFGLGIERDLHFKPKRWSEIEKILL